MEHFYVKLGDPSCIDFRDIMRKKRQSDTQTNGGENPTPETDIGVGNEKERSMNLLHVFDLLIELFVVGAHLLVVGLRLSQPFFQLSQLLLVVGLLVHQLRHFLLGVRQVLLFRLLASHSQFAVLHYRRYFGP